MARLPSTEPARRGRPRDPQKLRRILKAANEAFFAHGFEGANVDEIARAAGVSKMTVYSYFPSKDALFSEIIGARTEGVLGALRGDEALDPRRPARALEQIGARFQALMRDERTLARFRTYFAASSTQQDACRGFYEQGPLRLIDDLASYLREAHEAGAVRVTDATLAADLFLSMFLGKLHLHAMFGLGRPSPRAEKTLRREAVRVFLAAYGPAR
jgi:TetR/AcrR family transcriptional repressor of mexJK operon